MTLTPTQAQVLHFVAIKGFMAGGTGGQRGIRLATLRKLADLGLITLRTETHNAWFGGTRNISHVPVTEWVATITEAGREVTV